MKRTLPFIACIVMVLFACLHATAGIAPDGLAAAVAAANDYDVIELDPGTTYTLTAELLVSKAITIRGAGIGKTIIKQTAFDKRCVNMNHANARIEGVSITGATTKNVEGVHGLGVYIDVNGGTVSNCSIYGNSNVRNWTHGFGVYMVGPGLVSHCVITNNVRTGGVNQYGGGIYATKGTVDNCLVAFNSANNRGGGISVEGTGAVTVRNCTFVKNASVGNSGYGGTGGGVYFSNGSAIFVNCIFALNTSVATDTTAGKPEWDGSAKPTFTNCSFPTTVTTNQYVGGNCLLIDPLFVSAGEGNFRVYVASGTKDAGVDYVGMAATDLDGADRVSGEEAVDLGCYEFDSNALTVAFLGPANGNGFVGSNAIFTASSSGLGESAPVTYNWTVTSPSSVVTHPAGNPLTLTPDAAGIWTISVTATSGGVTTDPYSDTYYAVPRVLYVKEATAANMAAAVFPYDSWETAATNVCDAVAATRDGCEIYLDAGEMRVSQRVNLSKRLILSGKGWDKTTLRQTASTVSVLYLNAAGAMARGMTITGMRASGEIHSRGAVIIDVLGGTVEDCRITGNLYTGDSINQACGIGITVNSSAGVCRRCIIDRNKGSNGINNDRGGGVQGLAGLLENCLVYFNTNKYAAGIYINGNFTVRNCTVYGNVAVGTDSGYGHYGVGGLGVYGGTATIQNSIFAANTSPNQTWSTGGYPEWRVSGGTLAFVNSMLPAEITWPASATDCLNGDPLFQDYAAGNFRLTSNSPCRDEGVYAAWMDGALDLDGKPRVDRGTFVDIGCFENQAIRATLLLLR